MREIKFRAINANNKMIYGLPYTDSKNETTYYKDFNNRLCWRNEEGASCNQPYKNGTLMQYIEIKDKSGVEIYEGDILNVYLPSVSCHTKDRIVKKVVSFEYGAFTMEWIDKNKTGFWSNFNSLSCDCTLEVIGNIYENPELLKDIK